MAIYQTPLDFSIGYQNIEGLHSPLFGCKLPYVQSKLSHDIEVLSETWGKCEHDKNIPGYKLIEHILPQKLTNVTKGRASGGILIYCKTSLEKYIKKGNQSPYYLWLEIDRSLFLNADKSIRFCIIYNPPENSHYCNRDLYEEISLNLFKNSGANCPVILLGDMNSRTGSLVDFEELETSKHDVDERVILDHGRKTIPTERDNCDQVSNNMGKKLIDLCKAHDLLILNGRTVGDPHGKFTFYDTSQGASTIDLAVASNPLIEQVKSFVVHQPDEFTKHCKITLRIKNFKQVAMEGPDKKYKWIEQKPGYKWSDESEEKFKNVLKGESTKNMVEICNQYLDAGLIELSANKIDKIYSEAAKQALETKKGKPER